MIWKHSILAVLAAGLGSLALLGASQVHLREGTPVRLKLASSLSSAKAEEGARVDFTVAEPVEVDGVAAIPVGAVAWGAVQDVREGKFIKFDIEALRLPSLQQVKLRTLAKKSKNPEKDQIKVENKLGDDVGLESGAEFVAYIDEDADVNVPAPSASEQPANPAPSAAPAPPAAPAAPSSADLVTVQCFSYPMGADILIDGDFVGDTPSILKLTPAKHQVTFQLDGYKTVTQPLDLTSDTGLRTVQVTLEKIQ